MDQSQDDKLKELRRKFLADHEFYAKSCLKIRDKSAHTSPLELNRAQLMVHQKLQEQWNEQGRVRAIVLKARQEGISTYVASRFFRRVQFLSNQEALIIADELGRGGKLFEVYERFYNYLPAAFTPLKRSGRIQKMLHFANPGTDAERKDEPGLDSKITVLTAGDSNVGRASTVQMLHLSEVAFWEKGDDAWVSLMSGLPDAGTEVIVESTANGVGNLFYQEWEAAESGASDFIAIFLPWWIQEEYALPVTDRQRQRILDSLDEIEREAYEVGIFWEGETHKLSVEQLAWRRDTIRNKLRGSVRAFQQEFPANAREAFVVSGNAFFSSDALLEYERETKPPRWRGNFVPVTKDPTTDGEFEPSAGGYLRMWEKPHKNGHYVIAADTAEGKSVSKQSSTFSDPDSEKGGRDFSSADVLRVDTRAVVASLHGRMAPEHFAAQLSMLGRYFHCPAQSSDALIAVERNHGSGQTVLARLRDVHDYPNLYYERQFNKRTQQRTRTLGWRTTGETRPAMLDELAYEVREHMLTIPSADTIREMFAFVRGDDGKPEAQEGTHDDRVISLAITLQMLKEHACATGGKPVDYDTTFDNAAGW